MFKKKVKEDIIYTGIFEKKLSLGKIFGYLVLIGAVIIVIIPILITVFASLKNMAEIGQDFPLKPPSRIYFDNYIVAFVKGKIPLGFLNVIIISAVAIPLNILFGSMVAFILSRFDFKLKKLIFGLFLMGMMVPSVLTEVSRFSIISDLGLYNTLGAPIIIYTVANIMQIYIFLQFMDKIPVSLDESALIDGCSYFGIYFRIIIPLIKPAVATISILNIVMIFNDMFIPYLYMPSPKLKTLTTVLMSFTSAQTGQWTIVSAAIILVMLPTVGLYLFMQRFIFAGLVSGAVKE